MINLKAPETEVVSTRSSLLDAAVRQAAWKVSAFGHRAELKRMWCAYLAANSIPDDLYRWVISYWRQPPERPALV